MGETDISFRHLLRGLPRPFLQLVFPDHRIEPLGPMDPSVDRPRRRTADSLFRVRAGTVKAAIHVEIERGWRPDTPRRMFEYASSAVTVTRLPVWSILVLLRPGGRPPAEPGIHRISGLDGDAFVFRYRVVSLWQLDARSMREQLGIEAAPYYVAMRGADTAFLERLVEELRLSRRLDRESRSRTLQLLYVVTAAILGDAAAERSFQVALIEDPNVQAMIRGWQKKGREEGRAKGREEGRAKGREEGRAKGREEGLVEMLNQARAMLYKVLAARSLKVSPKIRALIDGQSDIARLEAWTEIAVNADVIGDVFAGDARAARSTRRR